MSRNEIAATRHMSKSSVSEVIHLSDDLGITYDDVADIDADTVYRMFYPDKYATELLYTNPDYEYVHKELTRVGVNLKLLWKEYKDKCASAHTLPMGYTKFCSGYSDFTVENKLTNHLEDSIYYKDNKDRTITLENCLQKVITNEKAPLRRNLAKIIELRNTSTHFVTEEYEMIYIPLFQACILNFVEKMQEFHGVDMTEVIPQNFLTLAVSMKALDENVIRAKYPEEIANKMISTDAQLRPMIEENNQGFAIKIEHLHFITKDKNQATSFVHVDKNAEAGVKIIKELKDPNNTHKYTMKTALKEINRRLLSEGIELEVNQYIFGLFTKVYGVKENEKFCYVHRQYFQQE